MRSSTAALAALLTAALATPPARTGVIGSALRIRDGCVRATDWETEAPGALRKRGEERTLWVAWRGDADRASAALLLRELADHPRCRRLVCRLALCHAPRGLCALLEERRRGDGLDAAFVAGFQPISEMSCPGARYVSAVGRRPAPLLRSDGTALSGAELRTLGVGSFRFRDDARWPESESSTCAGPRADASLEADAGAEPALLVAEEVDLLMHAPWLLDALRAHAPPLCALTALLAAERGAGDRGRAALGAARARAAPPAGEPALRYTALVYLCREDDWEAGGGAALIADLLAVMRPWTLPHRVEVAAELTVATCREPSALPDLLRRRLREGGAYRVLGAVAAGAGAEEAARRAPEVAVLAYDAQADGAALQAGPRPDALAAALGAALRGCGWRRVALLSDGGAAAARVAEALRAPGPLRRATLPTEEAELRATLRSLRAEGATVVVLNADGWTAERALRLALEEGLGGCAWLAREWTARAPPPVPLLALRATPSDAAPRSEGAARVLARHGGPRARAAPLAEALLTLGVGFARLFAAHEELRYDHVADGTVEALRGILRNDPGLPGVGRNLTFDERGARPPPVRLELWEPGGARREPAPGELPAVCPAARPAPRCRLPAGGDAFAPAVCLDLAAAVGAPALLLAALLAGRCAAALRRRAATRARARLLRLRAEAGAALLARQRHGGPALRALLVERERVTLLRALGAGRHGRVWLARLAPHGAPLAAKGPHAGAAPAEEGELLREAGALAPLRHEHVLRLLGVCVGPGPPLLLTAVAAHGDLLRYLRARRPPAGGADEAAHVSAPALTRLAREAALALGYLATVGVVHCDVRAANCLLDERRSLRLADFGMARSLGGRGGGPGGDGGAADGYYACRRRALFPVLWMAPESLARGAFSCASDVWALGVLALELVSLGARPFGALGAAEAAALVSRGGHARLPAGASADTRRLARACWRRSARARPSAAEVAAWLETRPEALSPCPVACPDAGSDPDARSADSGLDEPDAS